MDILKIVAVICTCIGTLLAAYKFFWKAPSEKEAKQPKVVEQTIATRLITLFESHGVHRNQIEEFFGHGLDIPFCATDEKLLEKITSEIINDAAVLFGVNKDWLEGSSTEIYNIPDFYKHPERFDSYIADLVEKTDADKLSAYALIADKKLMNIYNDSLFVIAEPIGEINQREIYKYHFLGRWGIHYWKSRAYFTACCALLFKHDLLVTGQIVKRNWISEIYEGQTLLEYDYTERYGGVNFPTVGSFIVSDFVEMPDNYLKGMNTEQGRAIPLALSKWLSLSENGYMRCFPVDEAFHASVEKDFKKKLEEKV
ncbi:hypothetical protein H4J50_06070 [Colwellia sp. 6M3]|jgi:hypothetical protein|uniref:hypothetical protein n=1 Tax=Colwellia sp. 6M3 TaxID=2759849 RepID=UPI0015F67B62|nr:hypothetical protein [Colwellia sp. 6M3]MBA6415578.1 hypothetical protein [Colwellia sp. 6M3]